MSSSGRPRTAGAEDTRTEGFRSLAEAREYLLKERPDSTRDNGQLQVPPVTHANVTSASASRDEESQNGQANETSSASIPPSNTDEPWLRKTLLTVDGGGVRGYSSLLILRSLMAEIEMIEREGDPSATHSVHPLNWCYRQLAPLTKIGSNKSQPVNFSQEASSSSYLPSHYFDYVAGTSTGGLIGIMLSRLSMTVDECLEAYEQLADTVFGHPRRFHIRQPPFIPPRPKNDSERLLKVIKDIIRQRDPLGHANTSFEQPHKDMCRTIVVAWQSFTLSRVRVPYLFRSYRHPKSSLDNPLERNPDHLENYQIWQVGLATSAAPSYFESVKLDEDDARFEFIDGGFGANNPSEEAYRSVKQLFNNDINSIRLLVSIGTGKNQEASKSPRRGYSKYLSYYNAAAKWATDSEHTHHNVYDALNGHADYYRLNVEHGLGKMKLDAWKGDGGIETLDLIRRKTEDYLATDAAQRSIKESARHLVNVRRARAYQQDQDRWERFCHGVEYRCHLPACGHTDVIYTQRRNFRRHLAENHPSNRSEETVETLLDRGKRFPLFPLEGDPLPI